MVQSGSSVVDGAEQQQFLVEWPKRKRSEVVSVSKLS